MLESISVVITCHNLESYIGDAVQSALNQDFREKYEVVVIDDFSTDSSAEIIKTFGNVRILRTGQNIGVLLATVLGIEYASGELIFFLDGDDVWESSKLSAMVSRFRADSRLALVTHDLRYIEGDGSLLDRESRTETMMAALSDPDESEVVRDAILLHHDYVWLGSAFAIRRALANVREFCDFAKTLPDPFNTYQDWPLAFWIACQSDVRFGYVNRKLFRYRVHDANYSGDASTVAKATRNLRRSHGTMLAINDIAARFHADKKVMTATQRIIKFYAYLIKLYGGERLGATVGFFASLPHIVAGTDVFWKELIRFVAVQTLGAKRFIGLNAARK